MSTWPVHRRGKSQVHKRVKSQVYKRVFVHSGWWFVTCHLKNTVVKLIIPNWMTKNSSNHQPDRVVETGASRLDQMNDGLMAHRHTLWAPRGPRGENDLPDDEKAPLRKLVCWTSGISQLLGFLLPTPGKTKLSCGVKASPKISTIVISQDPVDL